MCIAPLPVYSIRCYKKIMKKILGNNNLEDRDVGPGVVPKDCNQIHSLYNFDIMIREEKKGTI